MDIGKVVLVVGVLVAGLGLAMPETTVVEETRCMEQTDQGECLRTASVDVEKENDMKGSIIVSGMVVGLVGGVVVMADLDRDPEDVVPDDGSDDDGAGDGGGDDEGDDGDSPSGSSAGQTVTEDAGDDSETTYVVIRQDE